MRTQPSTTATGSVSNTPSNSASPSGSLAADLSPSHTPSNTMTPSPSSTMSNTASTSLTATNTPTSSVTPSVTNVKTLARFQTDSVLMVRVGDVNWPTGTIGQPRPVYIDEYNPTASLSNPLPVTSIMLANGTW